MRGQIIILRLAIVGWSLLLISVIFIGLFFYKEKLRLDYKKSISQSAMKLFSEINETDKNEVIKIEDFEKVNIMESTSQYLKSDLINFIIENISSVAIVDDSAFRLILETQEDAFGGMVDIKTIPKVGKIASANYAVTGKVSSNGNEMSLFLKLVDLESGLISNSSSAIFSSKGFKRDIENRLINESDQVELIPMKKQSGVISLFTNFFVENWTWIWTVCVIPIIGIVLKKLKINNKLGSYKRTDASSGD